VRSNSLTIAILIKFKRSHSIVDSLRQDRSVGPQVGRRNHCTATATVTAAVAQHPDGLNCSVYVENWNEEGLSTPNFVTNQRNATSLYIHALRNWFLSLTRLEMMIKISVTPFPRAPKVQSSSWTSAHFQSLPTPCYSYPRHQSIDREKALRRRKPCPGAPSMRNGVAGNQRLFSLWIIWLILLWKFKIFFYMNSYVNNLFEKWKRVG
jgi:hypothetical protein